MSKLDDVRLGFINMNPQVMDILEIFGDGEGINFFDMRELEEIARTMMEDVAGFTEGDHFNLFVMDNQPPATALVALLKVCMVDGISVTLHYWDKEMDGWHEQEWPSV